MRAFRLRMSSPLRFRKHRSNSRKAFPICAASLRAAEHLPTIPAEVLSIADVLAAAAIHGRCERACKASASAQCLLLGFAGLSRTSRAG